MRQQYAFLCDQLSHALWMHLRMLIKASMISSAKTCLGDLLCLIFGLQESVHDRYRDSGTQIWITCFTLVFCLIWHCIDVCTRAYKGVHVYVRARACSRKDRISRILEPEVGAPIVLGDVSDKAKLPRRQDVWHREHDLGLAILIQLEG